jgi:hypothetical protein
VCARVQRLFFLSALLLSLSSLAYSQDGGSPLPVPESLDLSEPSLEQLVSEPPTMPDVQTDPRATLEQRQAAMLKAWIAWSKEVEIWQAEVEASVKKAKASSEKLDLERLKQIESRDIEIAALREAIGKTQLAAILAGLGGALTGYITGRVTR